MMTSSFNDKEMPYLIKIEDSNEAFSLMNFNDQTYGGTTAENVVYERLSHHDSDENSFCYPSSQNSAQYGNVYNNGASSSAQPPNNGEVGVSSDPLKKKKKQQECSMCANHNIRALVRGHKYYCPYVTCTCDLCAISKNKQHYTKMQQKISRQRLNKSRNLQDQQQFCSSSEEQIADEPSATIRREFPNVHHQELMRDLAYLDDDFLDKINVLCKPGKPE